MKLPEFTPTKVSNKEISIINNDFNFKKNIDEDKISETLFLEYGNIFNFLDISDIKEFKKTIKHIVSQIRSSREYRNYIKFLKNEHNLNECSFLNSITTSNSSIELHHYPFSLYEIVEIVIKNNELNNTEVSSINIIEEVIKEHYLGNIGLVPLSKLSHDLAHNGKLFILQKHIFGNVKNFINTYNIAINEEMKSKLELVYNFEKNNTDLILLENLKKFQVTKFLTWSSKEILEDE
jgi:hypothetical protein